VLLVNACWRPLRRVLPPSLAVAALLVLATGAAPAHRPASDSTSTFSVRTLPLTAPPVTNPLRGLYAWQGTQYAPVPAADAYQRFSWRALEPSLGRYDFSAIDQALAAAKAQGRKFGLRVMALRSGRGAYVPDYVMGHGLGYWYSFRTKSQQGCYPVHGGAGCDTYVPDWNDQFLQERAAQLFAALGRRYDGDPRLSFVDVGLYGDFGEWHMSGFPKVGPRGSQPITPESEARFIDVQARAFPHKLLLMGTDDEGALAYALSHWPRMGLRRDSLGSPLFDDLSSQAAWQDWSSHAATNLVVGAPVYSGHEAVSFTVDRAYGEFTLHARAPFDTTPYTALRLAVRSGQRAADLWVRVGRQDGRTGRVSLAAYGGQPSPDAWRVYTIPLAALNAQATSITDLSLQDESGHAAGLTYYVDEIRLLGAAGTEDYAIYDDGLAGAWRDYAAARWKTAPVVTEFYYTGRGPASANLDLALQQVRRYHVSLVGNGNYSAVSWGDLDAADQARYLEIGAIAGYRLALVDVSLPLHPVAGRRLAITSRWRNDGVAPVYEPWAVSWQLAARPGGPVAWRGASSLDLRALLPTGLGPQSVRDGLTLPRSLKPGTYTLEVVIDDPTGYYPPLSLAQEGRQRDGAYALGQVTVVKA